MFDAIAHLILWLSLLFGGHATSMSYVNHNPLYESDMSESKQPHGTHIQPGHAHPAMGGGGTVKTGGSGKQ